MKNMRRNAYRGEKSARHRGRASEKKNSRPFLTITMVLGRLFASLSGVMWYHGHLLAPNLAEIRQQTDTLSTLHMHM
ncbi:hypothetical protein NLK92_27465 [Klebsiella pneumoniae]|nr:hypothetical protein [Klebsiella pneumoniae]